MISLWIMWMYKLFEFAMRKISTRQVFIVVNNYNSVTDNAKREHITCKVHRLPAHVTCTCDSPLFVCDAVSRADVLYRWPRLPAPIWRHSTAGTQNLNNEASDKRSWNIKLGSFCMRLFLPVVKHPDHSPLKPRQSLISLTLLTRGASCPHLRESCFRGSRTLGERNNSGSWQVVRFSAACRSPRES